MPAVLDLGVDHQAVGAVADGLDAERGLAERVVAVDVLPRADLQAERVHLGDQRRRELVQKFEAPSELLT